MVGLGDYHYFSRLYKKVIGLSPSLDRKEIQKG
jgi:YesN/AraC family two-component response regulator